MGKIYNLFSTQEPSPTTHSLESATALLPLVRRYTTEAAKKTEALSLQLQYLTKDSQEYKRVCKEYDDIVVGWAERVHRVGGLAKGLWLVDFDTGRGYLCWSYPEKEIEYFHSYDGSYKTRKKLGTSKTNSRGKPATAREAEFHPPQ